VEANLSSILAKRNAKQEAKIMWQTKAVTTSNQSEKYWTLISRADTPVSARW